MKKLLSLSLALVLLLSLVACPAPAPGETPTGCEGGGGNAKPITLPAGCQWFDNGAIRFAYPSDWQKQDGSVVMLADASGAGNNITVVSEPKSDIYVNMDAEEFKSTLGAMMEEMFDAPLTDVSVTQTANTHGTAMTKITYAVEMMGVSMRQTLLVVAAGDLNYSVTVTETTSAPTLVQNAFDTMTLVG